MNGSGFAPPLPAPSDSYPIIHTPSSDQHRRQCEGVNGRFQEVCQQVGQMMPGFPYMPGLPAGMPAELKTPPCMKYCTMPNGDQSTFDDRTGSWNPPLTALQGFGGISDTAESFFWKLTKSAAIGFASYMALKSFGKPKQTSKVAGWAIAGVSFLFL